MNWNGKKHLETYLPSVISNSGEHKVVVVDNNSSDDSVSFLKLTYPQIELIHNIENGGFAKGYNDALKKTPRRNLQVPVHHCGTFLRDLTIAQPSNTEPPFGPPIPPSCIMALGVAVKLSFPLHCVSNDAFIPARPPLS